MWSEYQTSDGEFTGRAFDGDADQIAANVAPGCALMVGAWNREISWVRLSDLSVQTVDAAALVAYAADPRRDRPYMEWRRDEGGYVDPRTVAEYAAARVAAIKSEGLARAQTRFAALTHFDIVYLVQQIMLSVAPAARSLTTDMQWLQDTYAAGKTAITAARAATTIAAIDAIVVAWPPL